MPEINTVNTQHPVSKIDWPKSGWSTNKINIKIKSKKLTRYFNWEPFKLSKVSIFAVINIKNGFNISIGCSLKKYRSNHRLAPLTSTPIIGTSARRVKEKINNGIRSFLKNEVSIAEIKNIIVNAINVKLKCLKKKK